MFNCGTVLGDYFKFNIECNIEEILFLGHTAEREVVEETGIKSGLLMLLKRLNL